MSVASLPAPSSPSPTMCTKSVTSSGRTTLTTVTDMHSTAAEHSCEWHMNHSGEEVTSVEEPCSVTSYENSSPWLGTYHKLTYVACMRSHEIVYGGLVRYVFEYVVEHVVGNMDGNVGRSSCEEGNE